MTKTTCRLTVLYGRFYMDYKPLAKQDAHLYEHQSDWQPKLVDGCLLTSMDWFQGKLTGKAHNSWEHRLGVRFRLCGLNQSIDYTIETDVPMQFLPPMGWISAISRAWRCYGVGFTMHSYQYQTSQHPNISLLNCTVWLWESPQESSLVAIVYHSCFGHF